MRIGKTGKKVSNTERRVVRVKSWDEFKQLVIEHAPKSIAFNIEQNAPKRNLTGLRLILPVVGTQYVFNDFALGDCLRKTGIPLQKDRLGNLYIREEDVKEFVRSETKLKDLKLHSYWTI